MFHITPGSRPLDLYRPRSLCTLNSRTILSLGPHDYLVVANIYHSEDSDIVSPVVDSLPCCGCGLLFPLALYGRSIPRSRPLTCFSDSPVLCWCLPVSVKLYIYIYISTTLNAQNLDHNDHAPGERRRCGIHYPAATGALVREGLLQRA